MKGEHFPGFSELSDLITSGIVKGEMDYDDCDDSVFFQFRLISGLLLVGELNNEGVIHYNLYNDEHPDIDASIDQIWVAHKSPASITDLMALV